MSDEIKIVAIIVISVAVIGVTAIICESVFHDKENQRKHEIELATLQAAHQKNQ